MKRIRSEFETVLQSLPACQLQCTRGTCRQTPTAVQASAASFPCWKGIAAACQHMQRATHVRSTVITRTATAADASGNWQGSHPQLQQPPSHGCCNSKHGPLLLCQTLAHNKQPPAVGQTRPHLWLLLAGRKRHGWFCMYQAATFLRFRHTSRAVCG
jgi:hypothetical protein